MTVSQLISKLQTMDQNADILVVCRDTQLPILVEPNPVTRHVLHLPNGKEDPLKVIPLSNLDTDINKDFMRTAIVL